MLVLARLPEEQIILIIPGRTNPVRIKYVGTRKWYKDDYSEAMLKGVIGIEADEDIKILREELIERSRDVHQELRDNRNSE